MNDVRLAPRIDVIVDAVCAAALGIRGDVDAVVAGLVDQVAPLISDLDRDTVMAAARARLTGLHEIERLLQDPAVDEVMVQAGGQIWIDRRGHLIRHGHLPAGVIDVVLERVLAPSGKRLDRTRPIVDLRLADGSRLCAVVDPVAVDGTVLAIRRHRPHRFTVERFCEAADQVRLIDEILHARCNLLVAGGTSSGKTTLLSALLECLPVTERVVVCEDTTEIDLSDRHLVRLESRLAGIDGGASVDLAGLVRAALRLRPDRLVIGEFRGLEVLAAVEAMNTGHDGSMATCHANSCSDAMRRVETLLMQAAPTWPLAAIRRQLTRSIDVVIHLERGSDGVRRVIGVAEPIESDGEPTMRPLIDRTGVVATLERRRRPTGGAEAR